MNGGGKIMDEALMRSNDLIFAFPSLINGDHDYGGVWTWSD